MDLGNWTTDPFELHSVARWKVSVARWKEANNYLVLTRLFQEAVCARFCLAGRKHYKQLCLVSLLQLPYCIHFSCCSPDHIHCMQLLFPHCICFSCCTPIASACDYAHSVQYEGSTSLVWTLHSQYRIKGLQLFRTTFFCSLALHYKLQTWGKLQQHDDSLPKKTPNLKNQLKLTDNS